MYHFLSRDVIGMEPGIIFNTGSCASAMSFLSFLDSELFIESVWVYPMLDIIFSICNSALDVAPSACAALVVSACACASPVTLVASAFDFPFLTFSAFNNSVILSRLNGIGVLFSKIEMDGSLSSVG